MVNVSPLVCLIYFIFLKIYQNKRSANTVNTVNLETYFVLQAILEKIFFSLRFHVTALFEKSKWIANQIINQHQFISVLGSIDERFLNFLTIFGR